jgi:hypothetical protein
MIQRDRIQRDRENKIQRDRGFKGTEKITQRIQRDRENNKLSACHLGEGW